MQEFGWFFYLRKIKNSNNKQYKFCSTFKKISISQILFFFGPSHLPSTREPSSSLAHFWVHRFHSTTPTPRTNRTSSHSAVLPVLIWSDKWRHLAWPWKELKFVAEVGESHQFPFWKTRTRIYRGVSPNLRFVGNLHFQLSKFSWTNVRFPWSQEKKKNERKKQSNTKSNPLNLL